jgi:hypothetical protein
MIYNIDDIAKNHKNWPICGDVNSNREWVLARPMEYLTFTQRLKQAWMVMTGKADVLTWSAGQ